LLLKNNRKYKNKMSTKTATAPVTKKTDSKPKAEEKKVAEPKPKAEEKKAEPKPKAEKKTKESKTDSSKVDSSVVVASSEVDGEKTRRVVNNEEVEKAFDALASSVDSELTLLRDDKNHSVGVRFLRSVARQLKTLKSDCLRLFSRKVRKTVVRSGNSGFMKSVKISPEIAKFCGFKPDQLVSRVDVTKAICTYVKEKNLQNPADRRQFKPDDKLAALLGTSDVVTYYTLQKHIQKHFPKA
jgi:upstream activation factor subunit UAF30